MTERSNVHRLIVYKTTLDALVRREGSTAFDAALHFISSSERITLGIRTATAWVSSAIRTVREAAEPNPYRSASDEEIACAIISKIEEKTGSKI